MISKTFDVKWLNKLTKDSNARVREAAKERLFVFSLTKHGNHGAIAYWLKTNSFYFGGSYFNFKVKTRKRKKGKFFYSNTTPYPTISSLFNG